MCHTEWTRPAQNANALRPNMKRLWIILLFLPVVAWLAIVVGAACSDAVDEAPIPSIPRVAQMPNFPQPYVMRDWSQVTRDYLDLILDFDQHGDHLPLVSWSDEHHKTVSIPSYVGGPAQTEAINYLAAVVSGSLVGLDMRNFRGQDWVSIGTEFFNPDEGVYMNRLHGKTGKSFWYDIFPNLLFYQINALYPNDAARDEQALSVASKWHDACQALGAKSNPTVLPDFDHGGLRLKTMRPVENGWIEPEAAAGIGWIEYMAWVRFKDPQFLTAADWCLRSLVERPADRSPLYEVLLPYGALTAARMNAELDRDYDVAKLVNECFDAHAPHQARRGWGIISDRWNGLDTYGLVGSVTDGEGYAFAMNTYEWAGALVPLARYDTRYAHDIGKWILNLANAARLFYPNAHDAQHQSSYAWSAAHDGKSTIAYEGIRKWKRGAATATADVRNAGGKVVRGSFASTQYRNEAPPDLEVFEESLRDDAPFEHIWELDLPESPDRWLVVAAERVDGGHVGNSFQFSFANSPDGPFQPAFSVFGAESVQAVELPTGLQGKLYVKAASTDQTVGGAGQDQLAVDAIAVSYRDGLGPFAQGDLVVSFISLLKEATVPIVLYRPASAATDLGLYGSSHVGNLGGIIHETDVTGILQLDLLKTDYFHAAAYPTFLYYNPHTVSQTVQIDVGPAAVDLYDAVSDALIEKGVRGQASFTLPPDAAKIVVLAPAGKELQHEGKRTLIDGVVVRYKD
jgi:hypothetical protein